MFRRRASGLAKSSSNERRIYVNTPLPIDALDTHHKPCMTYPSNKVVTSKYSVLSFLPKNLLEQFRRLANIFFLVLIILQFLPEFTVVDPIVAAMPTIIIVLVTAMKDGFEDYKRHITDRQVNSRTAYSLPRWNNVNYATKKPRKRWIKVNLFMQDLIRKLKALQNGQMNASNGEDAVKEDTKVGPISSSDVHASQSIIPDNIKTAVALRGSDDSSSDSDFDLKEATSVMSGLLDPCTMKDAWDQIQWSNLRVGDFVFMRNNEFIPADVVIVSTSEPDSVCYVETKNLDGETNLKVRKGMSETAHIRYPHQCRDLQLTISSEPPSNNMFTFNAVVTITHNGLPELDADHPAKVPINMNGVILRGCVLRNTSWVIGIVAYSGSQTKLRLNAGETPSKRSIIERKMNPQIVVNLVIMAAICLLCAIAGSVWTSHAQAVKAPYFPSYLDGGYDIGYAAFLAFWSALIVFQNIVPISLYLTVEIVKTLQAYFIYSDINMYYKELDLPCVPKSWNLADDLGQIEYVFSDKTGTLTQNVMEFRRCSINGVVYGAPLVTSNTPIMSALAKAQFVPSQEYVPPSRYGSKTPQFYDALLAKDMEDDDSEHSQMMCEFWRLLGICHTVLVSSPDPNHPFRISYKAQSPDEAALVDASKEVGFTFIGRHMTEILLDVMGVEEQYTLLAVLEFNSTRKRMSIVARRPDGTIVLYCKGADSVIFERLGKSTSPLVQVVTLKHLEIFADEGLRTLCLAYRIIPDEEFMDWIDLYNDACTSVYDREDKIDQVAELIEKDLVLLGATAIEDRLQAGVPECIQTLRDAGIKVWVLTGDKMETAISIGLSCNLLAKNTNLIVIKGDSQLVMDQIKNAATAFFSPTSKHTVNMVIEPSIDVSMDPLTDHALVIDGSALKVALESPNKSQLLALASQCQVVICCRVSPLQKAHVVTLVKDGLNAVTLAIGDGANDVSMIQAAHIGIGIAGEEGLQAVMASDYAIAQFRYLARLLLVHGRWSYHRITELIYNYFYKNIIFVFVIFWFQFWAGYSTQAPYEFSYMLFYNLFFTNWPVMVLGIFDQDIPECLAIQVPKLYQSGIRQTLYTSSRFWLYMSDGLYQSLVCYFIPLGVYWNSQASWHGGTCPDMIELGTTMAASSITSANLYFALNTRTYNWINHVAIWVASIGVFYGYLVVTFNLDSANLYGLGVILWSSPLFWFGTLISITLAMMPRFLYKFVMQTYWPTDVDIAMEIHKYHLDTQYLVPKPVEVEEPPTPPSAHPHHLSIQIPDALNISKSGHHVGSTLQFDLMATPEILQLDAKLPTSTSQKAEHQPPKNQELLPSTNASVDIDEPASSSIPRKSAADEQQLPAQKLPGHSRILSAQLNSSTSSIGQATKKGHQRSLTLSETMVPAKSITDLAAQSPYSVTTPNSLKNMTVTRNRGFSFSTDTSGVMRTMLMGEYTPAASPALDLGMSLQARKYVRQHKKSASSDWEIYRDSGAGPNKRKFVTRLQPVADDSSQHKDPLTAPSEIVPPVRKAKGHHRAHSTGVILNNLTTKSTFGVPSISPHGPSTLRTGWVPPPLPLSPVTRSPVQRSSVRSPSGLRNDMSLASTQSLQVQAIGTIAEESLQQQEQVPGSPEDIPTPGSTSAFPSTKSSNEHS